MGDNGATARRHRALHVLNRMAFGPRPGDLDRVIAIGPEQYVQAQLHPDSIAIPSSLVDRIAAYRTLFMSPVALFIEYQLPIAQAGKAAKKQARVGAGKQSLRSAIKEPLIRARAVMREAMEARLLRAMEGPRQLQEVMTAFWFNHFNVYAAKGLDFIWTGSFEETAIRPHTMGKFRDLLGATAKHPAMLFYLDNWLNTAAGSPGAKGRFEGINENYARELMELHTLGVNGGYTQADVIALAHILTGWGLPKRREEKESSGAEPPKRPLAALLRRRRKLGGSAMTQIDPSGFYFDPERHDFSAKTFLGRRIEGGGIAEGERALDILASHPSTANHLSYQLAQYFVADDPPKTLVDRMAGRYLATGGEIRSVLETMFTSTEFWDPKYYAVKFKTPYEYVISSVRATGAPVRNYRPLYGTMQLLGMLPYGCQTPNGYSDTQEKWLNPDAMMTRLSFATGLGAGYLPLENAPFKEEGGESKPEREPVVVRKHPERGEMRVKFDSPRTVGPRMTPPDPAALAATLGGYFSPATVEAIEAAPVPLRSALLIGSPEFMKR